MTDGTPTDSSTNAKFSSRTGFLLAAAGSAVGLGNIWRFPFVTGENGGGAFLLPYFIALVLIGVPAMVLEFALGRSTGKGIVQSFAMISPKFRYVGMLIAMLTLLLLSYYLVVTGWVAGYLVFGLADKRPQFDSFTAGGNSLLFFVIAAGLTVLVVRLGVGGIEKSSKLLMPLMFVILVGLMIYSLTLDGVGDAIDFYLAPDFESLGNPTVWVRAIGQVFFSVGVGGGILITYGAYMHQKEDIVKSASIVAVADSMIAVIAGLVIFPIVFTLGGTPEAGPELAFDTLPLVLNSFSPVTGYVVGVAFYLSLTVAALTSAIALLQTAVVALQEFTGITRNRSLIVASLATLLLGVPSALSYSGVGFRISGERFLDLMDASIGNVALPVAVLVTVIVVGWFGIPYIRSGLGRWGPTESVAIRLAKWVVPIAIIALLVAVGLDLLLGRIVPETSG